MDPLHCIFNESLKQGHFPAMFKSAKICPVRKNGLKSDIKNYRPIVALSCTSNLFEACIYKIIYGYYKS